MSGDQVTPNTERKRAGTNNKPGILVRSLSGLQPKLKKENKILILYGTQTGTSENYGHRLFTYMLETNFKPVILNMEQFGKEDFTFAKDYRAVLFITSTYGCGAFPRSAKKFWKKVQKLEVNSLAHMRYSVFGIGNSGAGIYFCAAARTLDDKLSELGATRLLPLECSCELKPDGHETAFERWKQQVWEILEIKEQPLPVQKQDLPITVKKYTKAELLTTMPEIPKVTVPNYSEVRIKENKKLTPDGYPNKAYKMTLDLKDTGIEYPFLGHVTILPKNSKKLVHGILKFFNLDGAQILTIDQNNGVHWLPSTPITTFELFERFLDFMGPPTKFLVNHLCRKSKKGAAKLLHLVEDQEAWDRFIKETQFTIAELLLNYSDVAKRLTLEDIISVVPPIKPRVYTISSHPDDGKEKVEFIYSLRKSVSSNGKIRRGLCTSYLCKLKAHEKILIATFQAFDPPLLTRFEHRSEVPLLVIALGSGIGGAISLLKDRKKARDRGEKIGTTLMYYACRHQQSDYLCKEELKEFVSEGIITELIPIFSHDTPQKLVFVQDVIRQNPDTVFKFFQHPSCCYFYSGLGGNIPQVIESTIKSILEKFSTEEEKSKLNQKIDDMKANGLWTTQAFLKIASEKTKDFPERVEHPSVQKEIVIDNGSVIGGTFKRLAEFIMEYGSSSERSSFLLGFRKFGTPKDLFDIFIEKWNITQSTSEEDGKDFHVKRMINFLHCWIEEYAEEVRTSLNEEVTSFCSKISNEFPLEVSKLKEQLSLDSPVPLMRFNREKSFSVSSTHLHVRSPSKQYITPLKPEIFLGDSSDDFSSSLMSPGEVATQSPGTTSPPAEPIEGSPDIRHSHGPHHHHHHKTHHTPRTGSKDITIPKSNSPTLGKHSSTKQKKHKKRRKTASITLANSLGASGNGLQRFKTEEDSVSASESFLAASEDHHTDPEPTVSRLSNVEDKKLKSQENLHSSDEFEASKDLPTAVHPFQQEEIEPPQTAGEVLQYLFDIDPKDFAEQLTLHDLQYFLKLKPLEFLSANWLKKDKWTLSPNLTNLNEGFNIISNFVISSIVTAQGHKNQVEKIEHCIRIAYYLYHLKNYNSFIAVMTGLNSYIVTRLTNLWKEISSKCRRRFEQLSAISSYENNFQHYQDHLVHHPSSHIPFLGVTLRLLILTDDGNVPTFSDGLINFEKMTLLWKIIYKDILHNQKAYLINVPQNDITTACFEKIPAIDEDELFEISKSIQPPNPTKGTTTKKVWDSSQLLYAISQNKLSVITQILKEASSDASHAFNINEPNKQGLTALHLASIEGSQKIIKLLCKNGANVNLPNSAGETPLFLACKNSKLMAVKELIRLGAKLNIPNSFGQFPIHISSARIVTYLQVAAAKEVMNEMQEAIETNDTLHKLIEWSPNMSVGVKALDKEHIQLVETLNRLWVVIHNTNEVIKREQIGVILLFLSRYTEFHFQNEEVLFASYDYPMAQAHRNQHRALLKQVHQHIKRFKTHPHEIHFEDLLKFLQEWLVKHILKEDMAYKEFFNSRGIY